MMRAAKQIRSVSATAGATADTGVLDVEEFHSLLVIVGIAGAASGAVNGYVIDEQGSALAYYTQTTLAIGSTGAASIGREAGAGVIPVPRRFQLTAVSGGAGTATITVIGIADEPDNV